MSNFAETSRKMHKRASEKIPEYQPWGGYYLTRSVELEIVFDLLNLKSDDMLLEIGCGNGFYSALLSPYVRKVYSGDLEAPNSRTHTIGITKAKNLLEELNISNVSLSSFSGSELPFKDDAFDIIFSSSTLEHISDREKAAREIRRVLKPGGRAVVIVPNFLVSIYFVLHMPLYLCMAVFRRIFRRKPGRTRGYLPENNENKNVFVRLGEILSLKPHGEYRNLLDELRNSYPSKWERLLQDADLKVLCSKGTIILPWTLISVFSSHAGAYLYDRTKNFHKKIVSKYGFLKYLSYLICIVAKK